MNTDKYYWEYVDIHDTSDFCTRGTIQRTSGWIEGAPYEYMEPIKWTVARGSTKSSSDELIRCLARSYIESQNKNGTTYSKMAYQTPSKLPDSYPKGNLDDLLGVGEAD